MKRLVETLVLLGLFVVLPVSLGRLVLARGSSHVWDDAQAATLGWSDRTPEPGFRSVVEGSAVDAESLLAEELDEFALERLALPFPGDSDFEAREGETVTDVRTRVASTAWAVARLMSVADPIWSDDDGTRTARLLMCVALYESRFRGYVDDGRCNDPNWRASEVGERMMRLGDCDGGRAVSMWQLHRFTGDRAQAVEEALRRLRTSIALTGDLRGYTGELEPGAPKARARLACAQD